MIQLVTGNDNTNNMKPTNIINHSFRAEEEKREEKEVFFVGREMTQQKPIICTNSDISWTFNNSKNNRRKYGIVNYLEKSQRKGTRITYSYFRIG